jgi:hypothetical protein
VVFETFNVAVADITASTPSLQVPDGLITDHAVFHMPAYSTRIDTLSRAPHAGFDVNAFTLDGLFTLDAAPYSVVLDTFILGQNPHLPVTGNPSGNSAATTLDLLQTTTAMNEATSQRVFTLSTRMGFYLPQGGATSLVSIDPNWFVPPADDNEGVAK